MMKAIILAGGTGSRLSPLTIPVTKHLLPIYDKPMIYYPLSVLMLAGIRDICLIVTNDDLPQFRKLLGDGSQLGIQIEYMIQTEPKGIAEAFILAEDFIGNDNVCLILGDNVFYGQGFTPILQNAMRNTEGALLFAYAVKDPHRFGVVEFDECNKVLSVEEKPQHPKSNYAITGLYFYDNNVVKYSKMLRPSARGELEITDINRLYLANNQLHVQRLGRGFAWLDTGTFSSLLAAGQFVETIEERQGYKIACLEEIAYNQGWIDREQLIIAAKNHEKNSYGEYLLKLIGESNDKI